MIAFNGFKAPPVAKIVRCSARRAEAGRMEATRSWNLTRRGHEVALVDAKTRIGKTVQLDASPVAQRLVERFPWWAERFPTNLTEAFDAAVIEVRWTCARSGRFEAFEWWLERMLTKSPIEVLTHAIEMHTAAERFAERSVRGRRIPQYGRR